MATQRVHTFWISPEALRADRTYGEPGDFPVWYVLRVDLTESGDQIEGSSAEQFEWHNDGVVVQRETRPIASTSRCNLTIFLSASQLQTDLTGFRLQDSEEKQTRLQQAFGAVVHDLHMLMTQPETFFRQDLYEHSHEDMELRKLERSWERSKKLGQVAATLVLAWYMPIVGAGLTVAAGASVYIMDFWPQETVTFSRRETIYDDDGGLPV